MALTGELYETIIRIVDQRVGEIKVTREDFDKLTKTVSELSGAVRDLAERMVRLEDAVEKLAEAQRRTEERLSELAEAQKRTEERVLRLEDAVEKLIEAQKRTDERLSELAEAQKRTEDAVGRLAVAVGRLSDTIGYGLEDVAMVMLPPWLERHENVKVEELERRIIEVEGESVEINLYGEGLKGRKRILVVGEVKSRIHQRDVREFAGKIEKIRRVVKANVFPVMFGYWVHPAATSLGKSLNIRLVASYQR
ncbi:MAG: hypothetical protein QXN62_02195 [Candidatus Bathyarchaeia archaeon]|nr:hypothetical protein [Candidatus Bathyarchaeota archaeon]